MIRKDHFCHSTVYTWVELSGRAVDCRVLHYNGEYVKCSGLTARGTSNAKAVVIESFYVQKYYITINNFKHKY